MTEKEEINPVTHNLEQLAIQAALAADWEKAIDLNKQILKLGSENLEASNRLGRAYSEVGQIEKAKYSYREVLKHDPYNTIALKNLERLKAVNGSVVKITGSGVLSPDLFMEEPGKTKVLEATSLAKPEILAQLHTGDEIKLDLIGDKITFKDAAGNKLGSYDGELAPKLIPFLRGGNLYKSYVKSVKPSELRIFVKEIRRSPKFANSPSFPTINSGFKPYVHESALETITTDVEIEPTDTTATEAAVAKRIASVETLIDEEQTESPLIEDSE